MSSRSLVLGGVVAALVFGLQSDATASGWRDRLGDGLVGRGIRNAVPSRAEVRDVPRLSDGSVAGYPVQVVRYGLNLHPGARTVRAVVRNAVNR